MVTDVTGIAKAVKPITSTVGKLLYLFLRPAATEGGRWLGDLVRIARESTVEKVMAKAKAKLEAANIEIRRVPPKVFIPLAEACSLEDEEDMIDRWANLLAAAASPNSIPPLFVKTLSDLSPDDARLLEALKKSQKLLPKSKIPGIKVPEFRASIQKSPEAFTRSVLCLFQLGLIENLRDGGSIGGPRSRPPIKDYDFMSTSAFGDAFLEACTPPSKFSS
jgi:Abortive infection alpha